MTDLEYAAELAQELDTDCIDLGIKLVHNKEEFKKEKHSFPLAVKARKIKWWVQAVIDQNE